MSLKGHYRRPWLEIYAFLIISPFVKAWPHIHYIMLSAALLNSYEDGARLIIFKFMR